MRDREIFGGRRGARGVLGLRVLGFDARHGLGHGPRLRALRVAEDAAHVLGEQDRLLVAEEIEHAVVEPGRDEARGRGAVLAALGEELEEELGERGRDVEAIVADVGRRLLQDAERGGQLRRALVEALAAEELVEDDAEREEIRLRRGLFRSGAAPALDSRSCP